MTEEEGEVRAVYVGVKEESQVMEVLGFLEKIEMFTEKSRRTGRGKELIPSPSTQAVTMRTVLNSERLFGHSIQSKGHSAQPQVTLLIREGYDANYPDSLVCVQTQCTKLGLPFPEIHEANMRKDTRTV